MRRSIDGCVPEPMCAAAAVIRIPLTDVLRVAVVVLLWLPSNAFASAAPVADSRIVWSGCPASLANAPVSGARMQCGWLHTGSRIDGQGVRLRVVVLRARPDRDSRQPVVYIPGGPGDAAGLAGAALVRWRRFQQYAAWPRDIVLFDPRATGLSRPRVQCRDSLSAGPPPPRVVLDCSSPSARSSIESLGPMAQASDIARLLDALHVSSADLWAVSYGSRIARTFAALFPARVNALILDSPVTTVGPPSADRRAVVVRALKKLLADCRQRLVCRLQVPSLKATLAEMLAAYDRRAPEVTGADVPRRRWRVRLTPERLLSALALASYRPSQAATTVRQLQKFASSADLRVLSPLVAGLVRTVDNPGHSRLVFDVTRCAYFRSQDQHRAVRQAPAWLARYLPTSGGEDCAWPTVGKVDPDPPWPLRPTLVIHGADDTVTPARPIAALAQSKRWTLGVLIPGAGHAATLDNRCAQQVVARFIARADLPGCAVGADWAAPYRQRPQ
ncbi:MAG: alpha/beta fold hydrolase [Salinisphaera sp.]|jgi:pimeloyl-ACP methyl ester carboxylesterase|nr:alpha/beta fold hydrolase [Salinisphaera sp.]